jgi:hypothetical protein
MKTIIKLSIICLLANTLVSASSCSKDSEGDTNKPVINLIEPEEEALLSIGDEHGVHFEAELSDDVMLQSYKLDIHPAFDGHEHSAAPLAAQETEDFRFNRSWDVSGQKNTRVHHHEIKVPAKATPGRYHLMVYCTDAAGNEAYLARTVVLH